MDHSDHDSAGTVDLRTLLAAQRAAFDAAPSVPAAVRKDRLRRALALVVDQADSFCDALDQDFGHRSRDQSLIADIAVSAEALRHALDRVDRWMRPERRRMPFPLGLLGARAWVEHRAKGVVGIISPWNFPVNLVMTPLAGVLAAGNRAMVKTSEFTPAVSSLFDELGPRYFAPDEVAFVTGDANVGRAFAALPFDHLLFTGATSVGRDVLRAAADNLTPVTLELGGKSPVIVGRSADLAQAAERIVLGKMLNAGQTCLAPDYLLVAQDQEEAIVTALRDAASALYPQPRTNRDYTAIISARHLERLRMTTDDAQSKGATIEVLDGEVGGGGAGDDRRMPLTLVRRTRDDMRIMQEEIFGPLLPIRTYDLLGDAIAEVNRRGRPLALYYFGSDEAERRLVLDRTISGGASIDDVVFHNVIEDLPFGGIGPSGMGAYHGRDGFLEFSHQRAIFQQSRRDIARLAGIKPAYTVSTRSAVQRRLRKLMR